MKYRNARYNENGTIDIEWEHPALGVIPFTASPDDPNKHGREIYAALLVASRLRLPDLDTAQVPDQTVVDKDRVEPPQ